MIPLQLRVSNFMCYRDDVPILDFDGIHLACLTGANGHGKSAILDAMTWALWGKARAKRDDELIHLGQSEMEVEFTFELGGAHYRVLRKRDSAKRGRTLLDLQVEHDGVFRSIAESTIRATQAAIDRLLRMDYETFANSAFLLQGKADSFTTRTPAERKRVLGEILGLSLYDDYEQRAKAKVKERDREVTQLDGTLRDIDRELARKPEYKDELSEAEIRVQELSAEIKKAEAALQELRQQQQALMHQQSLLRDLERRLKGREQDVIEIQDQIAEREQRLASYETALAERQHVEEGHTAWLKARDAEISWNERLAQHARLQDRQREVEQAVNSARRELDLALGQLKERFRELEKRAARVDEMENQLADVRARLAELAEQQAEQDATQAQIQLLAEESAGLEVRNDQLLADMEALREKVDMLQQEAGESTCPLCGQPLTEDHRDELVAEFESEGKAQADSHRANSARRREIGAERKRLAEVVRRLDRDLAGQAGLQRREAQLEQGLADAQQAASGLDSGRAELDALQKRLEDGDYAPDDQAELARLAAELEMIGYSTEEHERARAQTTSLAEFEAAYQRLQTALEREPKERAELEAQRNQLARWEKDLADDRQRKKELASEVERLAGVTDRVEIQENTVNDLQAQSSRARLSLGAAQQKLEHCRYLAKERKRHEANRQKRAEEKAIFEELSLAFGKRGIQAMIIEAVIPEIEFEANQLLSRMTDGRMNVRFETQRQTLKGDTVETLDINIADELGTRPYDLFSGGEAFRVNFAIRIALSKLLARRAGAQLEMLVIDEGFGTQDAEGRERLVEAITSIQDDFARILVITHIEELKDAFPVRIDVVKTASGSQISLN